MSSPIALTFICVCAFIITDNILTRAHPSKPQQIHEEAQINTDVNGKKTENHSERSFQTHPNHLEVLNDPPHSGVNVGPGYLLLLSEVNLDSTRTSKSQFIEIEALENIYLPKMKRGNNLAGYRLLLISGEGLQIVCSMYLHEFVPRVTKNFFTFGSKGTPNLDVDLTGNDIPLVTLSPESIFPLMDSSPFAVIIMHSNSEAEHDSLILEKVLGKYVPRSILDDEWRKDVIKRGAIDMVVLGRNAPSGGCSFFDAVFPIKPNQNYVLRDWASDTSPVKDMSISRCCDDETPFETECFKLALMTPGRPNDCFNAVRFVLEENLQMIQSYHNPSAQSPADGCESSVRNLGPEDYSVDTQSVNSVLSELFHMNTDCLGDEVEQSITPQPTVEVKRIMSKFTIPDILQFNHSNFEECQSHFTKPDEILSSDATMWLDFVEGPPECRFSCFVCREFVNGGFRPDIKIRADIVRAKGSYSKNKAANSMQIRRHRDHALHKAAMILHADVIQARSDREKELAIENQLQRERQIYLPTMNLIQIAYVELSTGMSFKAHRKFANVLPELGVNVGKHHRHERAIADIADIITKQFHYILLESLVLAGKPFTLIVDGTTMYNVPYMVTLIQTLEGEKPVVYLYALIVLTNGEKSASMVEDLTDRIKADDKIYPGFEQYFKTQCQVLASDSASNMVGKHHSFYTHLGQYLGRDLALSKCGAHKLGRILVHGLNFVTDNTTNSRYFKNFAHINNLFYTFYMSRGSKRFMDLTQKAMELDLSPSRIKYFFDIRFAASQYRCMKSLYTQYEALRLDLLERVSDPTFNEDAQKTAFQLHSYISDKSFAVTVAEYVDFLSVFQLMSRKFQTKGGLMIGNVHIVREGYDKLLELSKEPGYFLSEFLAKVRCPEKCEMNSCTLEIYDECNEIYIRTGSLENTIPNSIKLSEIRGDLYDNILKEMRAYFPQDELEPFDLFNPQYFKFCPVEIISEDTLCEDLDHCYMKLPTIFPNETSGTASEKLMNLCGFYGIKNDTCMLIENEWKMLLSRMVGDRKVFDNRNVDVTEFWPVILRRADLQIGSHVKDIILKIMVTAFTSSDAERLFSFLTRIKSPEKFNLKSETMEGLARIQFNGPSVLSKERLFEFTREFLKTHVRADDEVADGGRKPSSVEELPNFLAKSNIF